MAALSIIALRQHLMSATCPESASRMAEALQRTTDEVEGMLRLLEAKGYVQMITTCTNCPYVQGIRDIYI